MTSNEERMQVLKMVEEGKITSQEGLELLSKLEQAKPQEIKVLPKEAKWLRVRVFSNDDEHKTKVKVTIPLSIVKLGLKKSTAYSKELNEAGLDKINFNEIIEAVKNGAEGKIVDVEDDETNTKVEVYVE